MKFTAQQNISKRLALSMSKGFTLIELIIVIAILGVLAAVLITTIDPLDKINAANDAGAISTISQLGKANDTYASSNSNLYPIATTFAGVVTALNTAGEVKYSSVAQPSGYSAYVYFAPAGCVAGSQVSCTTYVFYTQVKSKKYTATPFYMYANGKGCVQASAPTDSTATCP